MPSQELLLTLPKALGGRTTGADLTLPIGPSGSLLVFLHGYRGFKDWGHFPLIAEAFADAGIAVLKYNFSMNGTSPEAPTEFVDLEAFGHNKLAQERAEVLWLLKELSDGHVNGVTLPMDLTLMGHSRGGGIAVIAAANSPHVSRVVTWNGVADYPRIFSGADHVAWEKAGVIYAPNARTGQKMPIYWEVYEDLKSNPDLNVLAESAKLSIPLLIVQGMKDETVPPSEAKALKAAYPAAHLLEIENADHTLGGRHPWKEEFLPIDTQTAVAATASFILTGRTE
jgi:uncharacterized protein